MLEKDVERYLIAVVRKAGGMCLKFVSPGWSGAPDRLVLLPKGRAIFVEVKRPGEKARPLQERRRQQLSKMGFLAEVVDTKKAVDELLRSFSFGANPLREEDRGDPTCGGDKEEGSLC